ncbi:MAG: hypothetical protein ABSE15_02460 [Candidatus Bathyarchaeia archaeon]|jgi:hypothetical protein
MVKFNTLTKQLLDERLQLAQSGTTPQWTDVRHFFYQCRNKFLRDNPTLTEIDTKADLKSFYASWSTGGCISSWCEKKAVEMGMPKEFWWRVREMCNIWAEARAVCEGEDGKFLIDKETRDRMSEGCSFVLLCEKKTVSKELVDRLHGEGYKLNIVGTGGQNPTDVIEAVLSAVEKFDGDEPTFYFLSLHDYDLSGLEIYFNLKKRYAGVIDVGVNRDFFKYLNYDPRLVEEQVKIKNQHPKLKEYIDDSDNYDDEDFNYLQGEKSGETWTGKRVEIDAIHVQYGIDPFVKYIMDKIEKECKLWDLSRIDVSEFSLVEPDNPFKDALDSFKYDLTVKQNELLTKIQSPIDSMKKFVDNSSNVFLHDYFALAGKHKIELTSEHWTIEISGENWNVPERALVSDDFKALIEKYTQGFAREYVPDFEDELQEINDQIKHYEGDVRQGQKNLQEQHDDLQGEVNSAAENDEEASNFQNELDKIDWGKEEFEALKAPDEKDVIKAVIEALQTRLKELEDKKQAEERPR